MFDRKAYREVYNAAHKEERKAYNKDRFIKNRASILAHNRAYYAKNRDRVAIVAKAYRDRPENKEKQKIYNKRKHLKRKYGLSLEQFNKIFDAQNRKCLICETTEFGRHGPVIDHCHDAGHIRGILCQQCNALIGMARNSPTIMNRAANYVVKIIADLG